MLYGIKLDNKAGSPAKYGKAIRDDDTGMDWKDDEAYSYTFEEDWEDQGMSIPPRPDCLRGSKPQAESFYDDEPQPEKRTVHKKQQSLNGVDPGRIKQLKALYQSVVRLNHERNDNSFVAQARKLADYTAEKARHVPFRSYWPTYEAMSKKQKEWYFYLRSLLRQGNYPKTDLSYLFVYIYEIINQVGVKDTNEGFVQLCGLWNAYRSAYPILDKYLVLWLQDYILIYAGGDFTTMMARVPEKSLLGLFPDSLAGFFMENPEAGFTLDFISRFSDYRFYTGSLAKSSQGGFFLSLLPQVFQEINQCLFRENGRGIFGIYKPGNSAGKRRIAFQNAIYSGSVTSVCQDEMPYSTYPPLRSFFTSVIKETENRLRAQAQIKGKLRGIELEPKVLSILQSFIMNQLCRTVAEEDKKKLEVDRERIIQLIEESNLIRQKLLEGIDEITRGARPEEESSPMHGMSPGTSGYGGKEEENTAQCPTTGQNSTEAETKCIHAPPNAAAMEENPPGGTESLAESLTEGQKSILSFILANGGEVAEGLIRNAFTQVFLELEMDEINSWAMDTWGDIILAREDGRWLIYEDYQPELEKVLQTSSSPVGLEGVLK